MSCSTIYTVAVPGPAGPSGLDGDDGMDGLNAYTTTTASFLMPAEGANVTIGVSASGSFSIGQIVFISVGGAQGHFQVVSKPTAITLQVQNLENTAGSLYVSNSPPTTSFASGATVSPAGLQGPSGSATVGAPTTGSYITQVAEAGLSGEQALSALATGILKNTTGTGVLTIATDGTDILSSTTGLKKSNNLSDVAAAATARTNLGLAIGTNVQAQDATLQSIAALGTAANKGIYTTGVDTFVEYDLSAFARTLASLTSADEVISQLNVRRGYGLIGQAIGVNMNVGATDNTILTPTARFIIDRVTVTNASVSLSAATASVYTAPAAGGTMIVPDAALSALTTALKYKNMTLDGVVATDSFSLTGFLYFRVGTPQGAPATADVHVYGWKLT